MSAIDSTPENFSIEEMGYNFKDFKESNKVDAKVNNIWLTTASSLCFIGAAVTGVLSFSANRWLFLAPSIPLFLASGALLWYASIPANTKALGNVQEPQPALSLARAINKYGWQKLAANLKPKEFKAAYSSHVQEMDLNTMINFYEEASTKLQDTGLKVPEPKQWKQKFYAETGDLKASDIAVSASYPIDKLLQYEIIGQNEYQLLKQITDEHLIEKTSGKATREEISLARETAKKRSDNIVITLSGQQMALYNQYLQDLKTADASTNKQIQAERSVVSAYEKAHPTMTKEQRVYHLTLKKNCEEKCTKLAQALIGKKQALHDQNQQAKTKIQQAIQSAHTSQAATDHEFEQSLKNLEQRDVLKQRLSQINQEYDRLRSA